MLLNLLDFVVLNNPLKNYLWLLFHVLLGLLISYLLIFLTKRFFITLAESTKNKIDDIFVRILSKPMPIKVIILTIFINLGLKQFILSDSFSKLVYNLSFIIYVSSVAIFIIKFLIGLIDEYFVPYTRKSNSKYKDQMLPVFKSLIKIIIFIFVVLIVLSNFGFNISALLAGMGIGGIAIALASKDLLENFLSGLVIFIEKPFYVGDFLKTSDGTGTVEEVGLRSTKIRTVFNTRIVVPNKNLSLNSIENVSKRRAFRVDFNLKLSYLTTSKQMKSAKKIITDILTSNSFVEDKSMFIGFDTFGEYSLDLRILFWILTKEHSHFIRLKDEIFLQIKEGFEKANIEFSMPSQSVYLKK